MISSLTTLQSEPNTCPQPLTPTTIKPGPGPVILLSLVWGTSKA